jgi:hypothetical protein
MAHVSQARKKELAPAIKNVLKKYGVKATIAVRHHSTLVLNIKQGPIDFIENYIKTGKNKSYDKHMPEDRIAYVRKNQSLDVNPYWYHEHFSGKALSFLQEIFAAMNNGNHNNSDIQTDYFDVGWYVDVNIGNWNKPYILEK